MGGVSIPSSGFGIGGSAMPGWGGGGMGGQKMSANTTEAVAGPNGVLRAYDPNTMARTEAAPQVPAHVENWLSSAGNPVTLANNAPAITQLGVTKAKETWVDKTPKLAPPPTPTTTPKGGTSSTGPTTANAPTLTQVPGSGGQGGFTQPLYVSDMWNGQNSVPMATPAPGYSQQTPQFSGPIFTDGKGNYFSDATGKTALPPAVVAQIKNSLGLYGHV